MTQRATTRGACVFCGKSYSRQGMFRHLQACKERKQGAGAEAGRKARLLHLFVGGTYNRDFWMHLEIPAGVTLQELDQFLRDIWLECCGHLSAFTIENTEYEVDTGGVDAMWPMLFGRRNPPQSMSVRLGSVLRPGLEFSHRYDFGSTTYLTLKALDERQGVMPQGERVRILARNELPDYRCDLCDAPAKYIDVFNDYQLLCADCVEEVSEEGLLPVVNSPRIGVCGYTGDAW